MVNFSNYERLLNDLDPFHAKLIAVSKTRPPADIADLHPRGQVLFGENRVQELVEKSSGLPSDIEWHLIGHLQTNKAKSIAPFVSLIHSIDSLKLLQAVDKEAKIAGRTQNVLLQFHIAEEETKFGLTQAEARNLLESPAFFELKNCRICGVMGMATFSENEILVRREFRSLRQIFENLRHDYFPGLESFCEISMGMSGDYPIALDEGSTMVRVGSLLWRKEV